jgi:hypothetical protein
MPKLKLTLDPVEIGTQALGFLTGLFKSKKHYNLYYWENADNTWKFVFEGHPSQIKPYVAQYSEQGIITTIVRNKKGTAVAPTTHPTGYESTKTPTTTNFPLIIAIVVGFGLIYFFIKKRK